MNKNRLVSTIALSLSSLALLSVGTASPARSAPLPRPVYDCTSAVSIIVTPDSRCVDLTYLSWLGRTRQELDAAIQGYVRAVDGLSKDGVSYTEQIGYVSATTTIFDDPTADEMELRRQSLSNAGDNLSDKSATSRAVEDIIYPIHLRAMHELSGVFSTHETSQPLTLQRLGLDK